MGRKAALWGIGLGTLPDLDVLVSFADPIENFIYHRSWSHSLIVLSAATPLIAEGIRRLHKLDASLRPRIMLMTWMILTTHVLLDSLTSYGTQLFWPLTNHPVAISSVSIIDPLYTLPLLIAVLWTLIRGYRRPDGRLTRSHGATKWALAISSLYLVWGLGMQSFIASQVTDELADRNKAPIKAEQLLVTPTLGNSALWYILAISGDEAYYGWVSLFDEKDTKIEWTKIARQTELLGEQKDRPELVRSLVKFTHGFYALEQRGTQALVLNDLRMGLAPNFVFRFVLADRGEEGLKWRQPTERLPREIGSDVVDAIGARMFKKP
jgi:inner membrane protein